MSLHEVFEMFYAEVRARQYLYYLINIVYIQDNYLPILIHTDNNQLILQNDVAFYYKNKNIPFINKAILNNIMYSPRTYLYNIDETGKHVLSFETVETDKVKAAIDKLNQKEYKKINITLDTIVDG